MVGVAAPISVSLRRRTARTGRRSRRTSPSPPCRRSRAPGAGSKHDDGRWALDYRTKDYWPAGTKVHVDAKLYGLKLATAPPTARPISPRDFTIGRNQVVIADVNSHELVVQQDGAPVATYPASYGRGEDTGDPNLITRSGIHVVNEFFETKLMSNPRYGYSNSPEKWAVRISNNGEFIHANPASTDAQGSSQRHPRLRQPLAGRRRGLLPFRDLGRSRSRSAAPRCNSARRTARSTSGRCPATSGKTCRRCSRPAGPARPEHARSAR